MMAVQNTSNGILGSKLPQQAADSEHSPQNMNAAHSARAGLSLFANPDPNYQIWQPQAQRINRNYPHLTGYLPSNTRGSWLVAPVIYRDLAVCVAGLGIGTIAGIIAILLS